MALYLAIFMGGTPIGAPLHRLGRRRRGPRWAMAVGAASGSSRPAVAAVFYLRTRGCGCLGRRGAVADRARDGEGSATDVEAATRARSRSSRPNRSADVFNMHMSDKSSPRLLRATTVENRALVFAIGRFVVGGGRRLIAFSTPVAIAGRGSLGDFASISPRSSPSSSSCRVPARHRSTSRLPGPIRGAPARSRRARFSHAAIALLAWAVIFRIVQEAFLDAVVFPFTAALLLGAAAALTSLCVFAAASGMTTARMAGSLCVFLVLGVMTAMLTSTDPYWWHDELQRARRRRLGRERHVQPDPAGGRNPDHGARPLPDRGTRGGSAPARVDAPTPIVAARRVAGLRGGLVLIGVLLALVGVISVDELEPVHIAVATGMLVVWGIVVFRLHKLVPGLARGFIILGYVFFAIIVASVVAFFTGYYNLTAVELLGFALIFAWLYLLVRNISAAAHDAVGRTETPRNSWPDITRFVRPASGCGGGMNGA